MGDFKYIHLNAGKKVKVDSDLYEYYNQWKWSTNKSKDGYATRTCRKGSKQKSVIMHREIIGAKEGEQVDHINRDRLDNRRSNLRICTAKENSYNASKRADGKSKYKGVHKDSRSGYYTAEIQCEGKKRFLGYYENDLNAAYYYNEAAKELFKEFAYLNELPEGYKPDEPFKPDLARGIYSKYRGVSMDKRDGYYVAKIQHKGRTVNLGRYKTQEIAAEIYNASAVELHKGRAILNDTTSSRRLVNI